MGRITYHAPHTAVPSQAALGIVLPNNTFDTTQLPAYKALTGHHAPMMVCYVPWADPNSDGSNLFPQWALDNVYDTGQVPVISWMPWDFTGTATQAAYTLSKLVDGTYDTYIDTWAAASQASGRPVTVRLMHEMNGNWYPWGLNAASQGNTAAKFVTAWRYIVDRVRAAGATNIRWAWCPNRIYTNDNITSPSFTAMYPGDDYVDELGLDAYNYGTTSGLGPGTWDEPEVVYADVATLNTLAPTKPVYIFETACLEGGGDKAAWITKAFGTTLRSTTVRGVCWFNLNKVGEADYRVNTTSGVLAAWEDVVKDHYWSGAYHDNDQRATLAVDVDASAADLARFRKELRQEAGDETMIRHLATQSLTPTLGTTYCTWYTARTTGTRGHIYVPTNAAASGLTSAFLALYSFDGTTLTRIAVTSSVHASFNGVFNPSIAIPSVNHVAGTDYVAAFVFNGGTAPQIYGCFPSFGQALNVPEVSGSVAGTTLPATIAKSSLAASGAYRLVIKP